MEETLESLQARGRDLIYFNLFFNILLFFTIDIETLGGVVLILSILFSIASAVTTYKIHKLLYSDSPIISTLVSLILPIIVLLFYVYKKDSNSLLVNPNEIIKRNRISNVKSKTEKAISWFIKLTKFNLAKNRINMLPTGYQRLTITIIAILFPFFLFIFYILLIETKIEEDPSEATGLSLFFGTILYYILIQASLWIIAGFKLQNNDNEKVG